MRLIDADEAKKQVNQMQTLKTSEKILLRLALDRTPTYEPPNAPLTLEELREMGRDWVWIELLAPLYRMDTGYYLKKTQFSDTDKFCCGYPGLVIRDLPYSLYGDSWLAYRHKPEEGKT